MHFHQSLNIGPKYHKKVQPPEIYRRGKTSRQGLTSDMHSSVIAMLQRANSIYTHQLMDILLNDQMSSNTLSAMQLHHGKITECSIQSAALSSISFTLVCSLRSNKRQPHIDDFQTRPNCTRQYILFTRRNTCLCSKPPLQRLCTLLKEQVQLLIVMLKTAGKGRAVHMSNVNVYHKQDN